MHIIRHLVAAVPKKQATAQKTACLHLLLTGSLLKQFFVRTWRFGIAARLDRKILALGVPGCTSLHKALGDIGWQVAPTKQATAKTILGGPLQGFRLCSYGCDGKSS